MRHKPTLREQLTQEKHEAWANSQALLAVLTGEVAWTEWQEVNSYFGGNQPYYKREGKTDKVVIEHVRYTSASQMGGYQTAQRATGFWETVDVRDIK